MPTTTYGSVDVFFVGDTQRGPRLYRELRSIASNDTDSRLAWAIGVALGRARDGSPRPPLDPDYRVPWPADTFGTAAFDPATGEIGITVGNTDGDSAPLRERGDLSPEEASAAVEALIRTAQGAVGRDAPVRFSIDGAITDQLLGVPTAEPLAAGPDLDVLSHVSLGEPSEGRTVRQGTALLVDGLGTSEDGQVSVQIKRWEGTAVVFAATFDLDPAATTLSPFSVTISLPDMPPGDYDVIATVTNADGTLDTDTRRITVVG